MRRAILAVLVTTVGLVLLLSFKPHEITATADRPAALSQNGGDDAGAGQASQEGQAPTPSGKTKTGTSATKRKVVNGGAADTRWGPVQVAIVLSGGKVTDVQVLQAPNSNHRDIEINDRALPILTQEALAAQSAQIDTVSGATYTSEGYVQSLQSALDKAGL
ncbi:FMN-binding protein [Sphaerisporangium perillae]|uniref:FMN-binding protein n=1 Tax=Sphaerisporangium perillae TaxID=2935860 RepID=UPI00200FF6F4|nr:FMN-binding protein [Sphaerisporangium perillae]